MSEQQFVVMKIGPEHYGAHVMHVTSVERLLDISPVPRTLPYIKGVANLRGTITPIIDLRERVGLGPIESETADNRRIVVVEIDAIKVGMIVDSVEDVVSVDESGIEEAPAVVGGLRAVYLSGVARVNNRILVLLNLEKILSDVEVAQLHEVDKQVRG